MLSAETAVGQVSAACGGDVNACGRGDGSLRSGQPPTDTRAGRGQRHRRGGGWQRLLRGKRHRREGYPGVDQGRGPRPPGQQVPSGSADCGIDHLAGRTPPGCAVLRNRTAIGGRTLRSRRADHNDRRHRSKKRAGQRRATWSSSPAARKARRSEMPAPLSSTRYRARSSALSPRFS